MLARFPTVYLAAKGQQFGAVGVVLVVTALGRRLQYACQGLAVLRRREKDAGGHLVACRRAAGGVGDLGRRFLVVVFVVPLRPTAGAVFRVFVVLTTPVLVGTAVFLRA